MLTCFFSQQSFGQSDMVIWDVMITMGGILDVLIMINMFELLI